MGGGNGTALSTRISQRISTTGGGINKPDFKRVWFYGTSETVPHEDLVSQRVAQNHANKLPVPRPLDVLAALTVAVSWVILEFKGNPDGFSTCGTRRSFIVLFLSSVLFNHNLPYQAFVVLNK